jgi:hypothetical protein
MRRSIRSISVIGGAFAVLALTAGAALASPATGPAGSAGQPVSITVGSTITVSTSNPTAWAFGTFQPGTTVGNQLTSPNTVGDTNVVVGTTDPLGFELFAGVNGPLTDAASATIGEAQELLTFMNPADGSINQGWHIGNLSAAVDMGGRVDPGTATFPTDLQIVLDPSLAPGSYSGQTITFSAQGK